ncbi:hypothetical protein NP493_250g01043 [Ridgeia piscesae]|uniref:Ribosomal protein mS38 C-terminal domain-containing protein n=1 Tax=Ridgeia piscesae TaxID=27915 RepID=A0AAD9NYM5_RIDPI|nr:hypothetical protein NP493_250g01043 [Ridgeia piscesae]
MLCRCHPRDLGRLSKLLQCQVSRRWNSGGRQGQQVVSVSSRRQPDYTPFAYNATPRLFNQHQLVVSPCEQTRNLEVLFRQLELRPAGGGTVHQREYVLPTTSVNSIQKKTILDPTITPQSYDLPTFSRIVTEKVTPPPFAITPIADPNPLQAVIDQGAPPLHKEAMPWLVGVRHRKMKKHKLKKFRKRMIFLFRKLNEIKRKKKEKAMLALEREFAQKANDFDPEDYVGRLITKAKRGGWGIDIFEDMRPKNR